MLDFGKADVNALDNDLMSPLHVAAIKRDADICLALVIIFNGFKFNQKITLNPLWWILAHFFHAKISCKEHVTKKKPCREGRHIRFAKTIWQSLNWANECNIIKINRCRAENKYRLRLPLAFVLSGRMSSRWTNFSRVNRQLLWQQLGFQVSCDYSQIVKILC